MSDVKEKTLVLRTCNKNMEGYGGFKWPRQGAVECPDWLPTKECKNGLFGLAWGSGDWSLLSSADDAVWMVVEVDADSIVYLEQKVKFPRGNVVFSGSRVEATIRVLCTSEAMRHASKEAEKWGEKSGDSSTAASSGYFSTAASSGDYSKAASSGNYSKAASSGNYSTAASSGDSSTAASSGYFSKAASDGKSCIAASIGNNGQAKSGENGLIIITYWVESEKRYRAVVGNVGEDGVEADTWYCVKNDRLSKVIA